MSTDLAHFDGLRRLLAIERRAEEERVAEERSALSQADREARALSAVDLEAVEEDVGLGTDLRRMNVALTRGKVHTFIVGDGATLGGHPFYAALMERAQQVGGYRSASEWPELQVAENFA